MMEKRKVLGRGLETLLPAARPAGYVPTAGAAAAPVQLPGETIHQVALEQIDRNPYQTRSFIDETGLAELTESIRTAGVLQPITLRPAQGGRFQVIAGERRFLASQRAGKHTIPAMVRHVSNEQAMEMTIVENLQREDLNPMDEARAFDRLSREFNMTQEHMAHRTGKDRATVANIMRLLKLPEATQLMIARGELSYGHGRVLVVLESPEQIARMCAEIKARAMSVRQTEEAVSRLLHPRPREEKEKPERVVDPNVRAAEEHLQQALGVRVTINDRKGKGTILLEYSSLEDFDRIVEALGG